MWTKSAEEQFFRQHLNAGIPPEALFYWMDGKFVAYYPKSFKGQKGTLQSRNSYIGKYTEAWFADLIKPIIDKIGSAMGKKLYVELGVISEEIELTKQSAADVAICTKSGKFQRPENIVAIFEVKMSVVWNWEYDPKNDSLNEIGDFTTHIGTPSLLRSDSMLKAIGKSVNIRASSLEASRIPIVVVGNTPVTRNYYHKVDNLKKIGIIQGFWSVNPNPLNSSNQRYNIKQTPSGGFHRFDTKEELESALMELLSQNLQFFGGMLSREELGRIIEQANEADTYEEKAERFLELLWGEAV